MSVLVYPAPRLYRCGIGIFPFGISDCIQPRVYSRGFLRWCGVYRKRLLKLKRNKGLYF
ncbi:MAG: hypothetical protein AABY44_07295 [Nitrospirota bacterium]